MPKLKPNVANKNFTLPSRPRARPVTKKNCSENVQLAH